MDINDFLGIGAVGIFLSAAIELIQARWDTGSIKTRFITLGLSVALGTVYFLFRETEWWMTVLGILASASTVYAFVTKDLLSEHK